MAKQETIEIISIEQVQTVAQLRDNIKGLKKELEGAAIGGEKYKATLAALKVNQNALKDAMYATSGELTDVTKAATGAAQSYNGLVHRMAALKEKLRATDVSTEEGAANFRKYALQIREVNDQLKEMDAMQGNYQRNVGNYASAFKGLAGGIDALGKGFKIAQGNAEGLKGGFDALSASPVMATIGIVATLAVKLAGALKEDEGATQAVKKAMDALQPVMDFFSALLDKVVDILAEVIDKVVAFVGSNGLIQKVIQGVVGVGNAIAQFVISPFKAVIAAVKVFQDEGVKGLGNAARAFGREMKEGVSFKANFETGQAFADTLIAGAKSRKPKAKAEARAAGKDIADELAAAIEAEIGDTDITIDPITAAAGSGKKGSNGLAELDKATKRRRDLAALEIEDAQERADELYKIEQEGLRKRIELLKLYAEETTDPQEWLDAQQQIADAEYDIWFNARKREKELNDKADKDRIESLKMLSSTTSSLMGSIADAVEASAGEGAKSAGKVKALRIASATIDTISGAIAAYMSGVKSGIPAPGNIILGAAQAATVTAAGMAQIAKMKSTQIAGASGGSAGAAVAAPSFTPQMTSVRAVASQSEEMRLDSIASKQRVYIVASDIETALDERKVTVEEASF